MARLQPDSSLSPSSPKTIPGNRFGKFRDSRWLDDKMRVPRSIGTDLAMLKWDPSGPVVVPLRKSATSLGKREFISTLLEAEELRRKSPQPSPPPHAGGRARVGEFFHSSWWPRPVMTTAETS